MNRTLNRKLGIMMFPKPPKDEVIECPYCGKHPNDLEEYVEAAKEENVSVVEYVKYNENTYCQFTGCFVCTSCYVNIGMPSIENIHSAFPYFRMDVAPLDGQNNNMLVKYRLGEV